MSDVADVKAALIQYFQHKAEHRRMLSEEHPRDTRNQHCAESLEAVAAFVAELPDDDSSLQLFVRSPNLFIDGDVFQPPRRTWDGTESESDREAFQCGFHCKVSAPAEWFADWVETVASEAADGEMWIELEE